MPTLRQIVRSRSGIDVARCQACLDCDLALNSNGEIDIPLGALIQLVLMNDEEVFTCKTLWSQKALQAARGACTRGVNIAAVILALREEAVHRGLAGDS